MRAKIILTAIVISSALCVTAQRIWGVVTDIDKKPMTGVTVSLLKATNSAIMKLAASQKDGSFSFSLIRAGKYIISVTHINYKKGYSSSFDFDGLKDYEVAAIALAPQPKSLSEVTVTAKKPMIELKADKTILNVEGTINAIGSDAFELLKKSLGV
ncbi:MAG: carboxypeptidase regulatory-like domain-containing protein [Sphingobacteriales bacterium]|nr:carboxypeptidase regulatory-like domain-containing protein [Sphingobacteriales bacterium]